MKNFNQNDRFEWFEDREQFDKICEKAIFSLVAAFFIVGGITYLLGLCYAL